jgi:hypothetical protein
MMGFEKVEKGVYDGMAELRLVRKVQNVRETSLVVQLMAMLEEASPIKPVKGDYHRLLGKNSFEDAMFEMSLLGLSQKQVFGIVFVLLLMAIFGAH